MRNLLRGALRRNGAFLLTCGVLLAVFQFMLCAAVATIHVNEVLTTVLASLPPPVRALLTERLFAGFTTRGMLAFGWNHPLAQALGGAVAVLLATRAVAGEVEAGTMELVLSQPVSRRAYLGAEILFGAGAIALLTLAGVSGTWIGQLVYGIEPFSALTFAKLAASFFLLQTAWFGFTLALSAGSRDGGAVASTSFIVLVFSFFMEVIGRLFTPMARLLPLTLYSYYSPQDIVVQGLFAARPAIVLAMVALAGGIFAFRRFERRDIP